ncbi:hypothetical protein DICPUDRAFT_28644 [Dictyostelium purpureum]|uniref:Amine oxidase n=1 Tax=Dictyostelium purpureum TaxID=5786 RepID=F0ZC96_DICPU|nr:uncharacterized protein DICPUDRAFT_28644 [Dictyostelium purpureum]EGC38483.1 hypothetical protein DICPUDRAFT_28644 [Dictyostelium purpureum]|eukprot:XP_003285041.1 hypothetical protein DICPUDRAFT_28644 [Dictyostelium purpureum]
METHNKKNLDIFQTGKIYDTIIIGGGLSGLNSAFQLKKKGNQSFLILESSNRLGGRTETVHLKKFGGWVDFGGQWLGISNVNLFNLINELGLKTYKQYYDGKTILETETSNFKKINENDFKFQDFDIDNLMYFINQVDSISSTINFNTDISKNPEFKIYDSISLHDWLFLEKNKKYLNEKIKLFFDWVAKMVLASSSKDISFLFFIKYFKSIGNFEGAFVSNEQSSESDRVIGGSQAISHKLASIIGKENYLLKKKVTSIDQTKKIITVTTDLNFKFYCKNVIVTAPPLQVKKINFIPKLPTKKHNYINNIENGVVIKVIAVYKTQFWREKGYNAKLISFNGPIQEAFDNSTHDNQLKSIVGFIVGKDSFEKWGKLSFEERKSLILNQYAKYWGEEALHPVYYNEKNWSQASYESGCFSGVCSPNQNLYENGFDYTKPFGNIHWAGTETSNEWYGHMEGAIQSSIRVTNEILKKSISKL